MAVTAEQLMKIQGSMRRGYGPVAASTTLYGGTMVFKDASTGYLTSDDNDGANAFFGIACQTYDNSGGVAGDIVADVYVECDIELTGSGFTQASNGVDIYATDNYTITTSEANASYIGRSVAYVSATKLIVRLNTTPTFDGTGGS